jgi:hypothetical protein
MDIPFPRANPPTIHNTKLKNIIFGAMLTTWQTHFLHVNDISNTTVLQLQHFMSREPEFAEANQNNSFHFNSNRRCAQNPCDTHPSRNNYSGSRRTWNNNLENPYRLHNGSDPWLVCRQNPHSQNYTRLP